MRLAPLALSLALAAPAGAMQDTAKRPPGTRDTVVVTGCVQGPTLQIDPDPANADALLPAARAYRLTGKREILRDLLARHDGQRVEITGVLESDSDRHAKIRRGRTIGRTRVTVGVSSGSPDEATKPPTGDPLPVLEVKTFDSEGVNCRR